jgi:hypothetical protein
MALTFWLGTKTAGEPQVVVAPRAVEVQTPAVYTPERGVAAEWFSSDPAAATVIVLEGLDAIPDTLDFSETAQVIGDEEFLVRVADADEEGVRQ